MGITRLHRGITRLHRGITIIQSSAAWHRWRRNVDPIHAALEKGLGDITKLARPHAVPGVPDNSGFHWELTESHRQKVGATIKLLSWSGADADARWV